MPRYLKKYSREIQQLISSVELSMDQKEVVKNCLSEMVAYGNVGLRDVFEDMYKLYIIGTSTTEIAKIYNRNSRTIQHIFSKYNLKRNRLKAKDTVNEYNITRLRSILVKHSIPLNVTEEILKAYEESSM